jgi:hypothetical protein
MRTVLRNIPTQLYVQSPVNWTSRPGEALDFGSLAGALKFARESGLRGMELVLISDRLDQLTAVPLQSSGFSYRESAI